MRSGCVTSLTFPGLVFVTLGTLGSLDEPERIQPNVEMFTKRRFSWMKHPDLPQFASMPH
jgi:hypothetical protein